LLAQPLIDSLFAAVASHRLRMSTILIQQPQYDRSQLRWLGAWPPTDTNRAYVDAFAANTRAFVRNLNDSAPANTLGAVFSASCSHPLAAFANDSSFYDVFVDVTLRNGPYNASLNFVTGDWLGAGHFTVGPLVAVDQHPFNPIRCTLG
jgi:hypothetical protein